MGLASLLSDQGKYQEAAKELRSLLLADDRHDESPVSSVDGDERDSANKPQLKLLGSKLREKATSMLFRTQAAICYWDTFDQDSSALVDSVRASIASNTVPVVHPFEALMWSCISLEDATRIARLYAMRAMTSVANSGDIASRQQPVLPRDDESVPFVKVSRRRDTIHPKRREKIKVGYISPDFTGYHPLAFLMQDVFRFHNASQFDVHIYSLYESDGSPEVEKIKNAANQWTVLPSTAKEIADKIIADDLDVIVDLCGYTGTSLIAEVMAHRVAPVQIGYMGFPASSGAPFMDYLICDEVVVPPTIPSVRKHYSERLIIMPHCYFVNSHRHITIGGDDLSLQRMSRAEYGLPDEGFVFCCHSRPDKIDPSTFRAWLRVLKKVRDDGARDGLSNKANATLWLLRSGDEMEENLRKRATNEFGLGKECLVFAEKAPRHEHLRRLGLADLFLDTPSYNAHTVGCDCLSAGVPMLSLLRRPESKRNKENVATEKLASRVGASLLKNVGLDELIVPTMGDYEAVMTRCVSEPEWFSTITERLRSARDTSPLFDTERWVRNLEAGLTEVVLNKESKHSDVYVVDDA
jgi:protein O-GlcNAc transferase